MASDMSILLTWRDGGEPPGLERGARAGAQPQEREVPAAGADGGAMERRTVQWFRLNRVDVQAVAMGIHGSGGVDGVHGASARRPAPRPPRSGQRRRLARTSRR